MKWTEEQLKLALALYCQLPFGKMHSRQPEIVRLAAKIGRTPSAVAMKLVNFASLDPAIVSSGRRGLGNASALDRLVWDSFQRDWDVQMTSATEELGLVVDREAIEDQEQIPASIDTTREAIVEVRKKQHIFRRVVISSYDGMCCMSGLSEPRLLVASHIVPWKKSERDRLNPKNGLCLSALHDRAFDAGLITVMPDLTVAVSSRLMKLHNDKFICNTLIPCHGQQIMRPQKFHPDPTLLRWHNENVFNR